MEVKTYRAQSKKIWIIVLLFALAILAAGIYLTFIKSAGYVKATALIISVREVESKDTDNSTVYYYYPTVKHTVDGKEYTGELDMSNSPNSVGKEVKILYDPKDPSKINAYSPGVSVYIFVIGGILLVLSILMLVKKDKAAPKAGEDTAGTAG